MSAIKHPTEHGMVFQIKELSSPNVNSAKIKKILSKITQLVRSEHSFIILNSGFFLLSPK